MKEHKIEKLPHHNFTLLSFDTPWGFNKGDNQNGAASNHYDLMSIDDTIDHLLKIQVNLPNDFNQKLDCPLVAKHGAVLIWVVGSKMMEFLKMCDAFNLTIIDQIVSWCKLTKSNDLFRGNGYYTRGNWEGLFLCVPREVKWKIQYEHYYYNDDPYEEVDENTIIKENLSDELEKNVFPNPYPGLSEDFFTNRSIHQEEEGKEEYERSDLDYYINENVNCMKVHNKIDRPKHEWGLSVQQLTKQYDLKIMGSNPNTNIIRKEPSKHSKKDKDAIKIVNHLFVDKPHNYIPVEIFARKSNDRRWVYSGNEIKKFNF